MISCSIYSCVWLLLLSIIFLIFIDIIASIIIHYFVLLTSIPFYGYTTICLCICIFSNFPPNLDFGLWRARFLWVIIYKSLWQICLFFIDKYLSGITILYGNNMFRYLRNHQNFFQSIVPFCINSSNLREF